MTYKHIFTEQSRGCQRVPTGGWLMSEKGPQDGKRKKHRSFWCRSILWHTEIEICFYTNKTYNIVTK